MPTDDETMNDGRFLHSTRLTAAEEDRIRRELSTRQRRWNAAYVAFAAVAALLLAAACGAFGLLREWHIWH